MSNSTVAVIVGSLSTESINHRLSQALQNVGRGKFDFIEIRIDHLPLYNRDLDGQLPTAVIAVKNQIETADGVLFVSPEYNRSVSAPLKNVLDWASRPYGASSWRGKVAAVAGASPGAIGTAVAQTHLRTILTHLDILTLPQPELYIRWSDSLLTDDYEPQTPEFRKLLEDFMTRFGALMALKSTPGHVE